MNKQLIRNQLSSAYQLLFDMSQKGKLDNELTRLLKYEVSECRNRMKRSDIDKLAEKLNEWGNQGKWGKNLLKSLQKQVYLNKRPDGDDDSLGQWVSVEIECIMPNESVESQFVAYVRRSGYGKFVTVKDDGSIHPDSEHNCSCDGDGDCSCCSGDCDCNGDEFGREIVVTFKYGDWNMLTHICNKLNQLKCTVNKTCGLHVHYDCRDITAGMVTRIGKRVALAVPALKQMLPKSRQNNEFCSTVINKHRGGNGSYGRYAFVNLKSFAKHGTLEIRGHSGTTDATKIINWIRIVKKIMVTPNVSTSINTISYMIEKFNFEADLVTYIRERQKKFKADDKTGDDVNADNQNVAVAA